MDSGRRCCPVAFEDDQNGANKAHGVIGTLLRLDETRRAAMGSYVGLDVADKQTAICVIDEAGEVALHARQASAALALQANKTDRNDAAGLARIVRSGWYRPLAVKSLDAHKLRALLATRDQLVGMSTSLANKIRSTLKTFGVLLGPGRGSAFEMKVREAIPDDPIVRTLIESLLRLWRTVREQRKAIDSRLMALARHDPFAGS